MSRSSAIAMDESELSLIKRIAYDNNIQAFELLLNRHLQPVFDFCYRLLMHEEGSESITQEVFIEIRNGALNIIERQNKASPLVHIYKLSYEACKKRLNSKESRRNGCTDLPISDKLTLEEVRKREEIIKAFSKIAPESRGAFILFTYHDFSLGDVAYIIDKEKEEVAILLEKARSFLLKKLKS